LYFSEAGASGRSSRNGLKSRGKNPEGGLAQGKLEKLSLRLRAAYSNGIKMRMVGTLALNLIPLRGKKEQHSYVPGFADDRLVNPVAAIQLRRRTILLLLGEKAGMREVVTNHLNAKAQDSKAHGKLEKLSLRALPLEDFSDAVRVYAHRF
jgi:hypothetical protein